jgi:antitoxin component YwqK of YwqJK toxin-antitoxin module/pimeloyl-ACP methyl ester carboxylesterase
MGTRYKYKHFRLVLKGFFYLALIIAFVVSCTPKSNERTVNSNKIEFRNNLFYCQDEKIPFTGKCELYFPNGNIRKEFSVKDGKYDGPTVSFYENGKKSNEVHYKQGTLDGSSSSWYLNRQKKTEFTYKSGTLAGSFIKWDYKGYKVFEKEYVPGEASVNGKINISSEQDVISKRDKLIRHIWGENGWPANRLVDNVETNIIFTTQDGKTPYQNLYNGSGNLKQIDCYKIFLPNSFVSKVYHFRPVKGNHKVFLYHAGHTPGGFHTEDYNTNNDGIEPGLVIPKLLKEDYDVVAFMMPLMGNDLPGIEIDNNIGKIRSHDMMFDYLEHPYTYFIEDMVATVNYLEKNDGFNEIYLMGLSGGGWTTTLYAALDPRIRFSFPVAGSIPTYLRFGGDVGDAEQGTFEEYDPEGLYGIANFEELYVLGSYGEGRRQIQILNEFDDCCFDGKRHPYWIDDVKSVVRKLGKGEFDFYLEQDTKTHKVSKQALDVVLASINNRTLELENEPPVIAVAGKEYCFTPEIKSAKTCNPANKPTHSLIIKPSWLSVDSQSGVITGKPTIANVGDTLYSYKVVDGHGGFIIKDVKVKVLKE